MRSWLTKVLVTGVALVATAAAPATGLTKAHHSTPHQHHARLFATETSGDDPSADAPEATAETGGTDSDAAAQAAACRNTGIDPNGSNVQYDDVSGACTADRSGGANSQQ